MLTLNRILLLNTMIKHETMTLADIGKYETLGLVPNKEHMQFLLDGLEEESFIQKLRGALHCTYAITEKGIAEGIRLKTLLDIHAKA